MKYETGGVQTSGTIKPSPQRAIEGAMRHCSDQSGDWRKHIERGKGTSHPSSRCVRYQYKKWKQWLYVSVDESKVL